MSHQAAYVVQPEHAIDMALAAQLAGRRTGLCTLEAESIVRPRFAAGAPPLTCVSAPAEGGACRGGRGRAAA